MMRYKGYTGAVRYYDDDRAFHGQVIGTQDTIHFTGQSVDELERAFRDSVDDYLEFCTELGKDPDKPFSGKLALRTSPETHRMMTEAASAEGVSVNQWMDHVLTKASKEAVGG